MGTGQGSWPFGLVSASGRPERRLYIAEKRWMAETGLCTTFPDSWAKFLVRRLAWAKAPVKAGTDAEDRC